MHSIAPHSPRSAKNAFAATLTILTLLLAGLGLVSVPAAQAAGPVAVKAAVGQAISVDTSQWFTLTSRRSGKLVDVRSAVVGNGTVVQQYTANGHIAQQFRFISTGDGYYRIASRVGGDQVLSISGGNKARGTKVNTWSWWNIDQQKFRVVDAGGGHITLKPKHAPGQCFDLPGGNPNNGVQFAIWDCNGDWAQQFKLTAKAPVDAQPYKLPFRKGQSYEITQGPAQHAVGYEPRFNRHAVDFKTPIGVEVVASRSGTVRLGGWDGYGAIQVQIDHGNDTCSQYLHLNSASVSPGQKVVQGQTIGRTGNTGISSGPHLHWNLVSCSTQKSKATPSTVEMGTSYVAGTNSKPSQNR